MARSVLVAGIDPDDEHPERVVLISVQKNLTAPGMKASWAHKIVSTPVDLGDGGAQVDAAAARAHGHVAQAMCSRGRTVRVRGVDAFIAAVALANGMPVHTANPDDFTGIPGLQVVDIRPGLTG